MRVLCTSFDDSPLLPFLKTEIGPCWLPECQIERVDLSEVLPPSTRYVRWERKHPTVSRSRTRSTEQRAKERDINIPYHTVHTYVHSKKPRRFLHRHIYLFKLGKSKPKEIILLHVPIPVPAYVSMYVCMYVCTFTCMCSSRKKRHDASSFILILAGTLVWSR